LAHQAAVRELFVTGPVAVRHPGLVAAAGRAGVPVWPVTDDAVAALAETVTPQGVVAVCSQLDQPLDRALARAWDQAPDRGGGPPPARRPRLVAVLVEIRDPGNAGTVLRTADAAGAQLVVFAGAAVDPYNGKCVRASAGGLFHVELARCRDPAVAVAELRRAGLRVLAATAAGSTDLDTLAGTGALAGATAWLFGSEAHGLPPELAATADARVRVPIYGRAESLNLAAAAAVCLYASARAQHLEGK
jgi:TrmH family RNA methyltransferase